MTFRCSSARATEKSSSGTESDSTALGMMPLRAYRQVRKIKRMEMEVARLRDGFIESKQKGILEG
jgi:hypothetical protein